MTFSQFLIYAAMAGLTSGGGGGGPFFAIASNLAESTDKDALFANIGLGGATDLTIDEADFVGNLYTLTNPCPTFIFVNATTAGNAIKLPPADEAQSFLKTQGPVFFIQSGFEGIDIQDSSGALITPLVAPACEQLVLSDNATPEGLWYVRSFASTVNGQSGDVVLTTPEQNVIVANDGSDGIDGNGSDLNPYATLSYALAQITDASASKPYKISLTTGVYTETNLVLKPWIYINGNGSQITVTNPVTLDASWSGGGNALINNFYNADFQGGFDLDFDAISQTGLAIITFDLINGGSAYTYGVNGSTAGTTIAVFNNIVGYAQQQTIDVTNCYGGISNSAPQDINFLQSDPLQGHVWNVQNGQTIGNLDIQSTAGNLIYFGNSVNSYGAATFYTTGTGTMTAYPLRYSALAGVKFDSVGGGLTVTVDGYFSVDPIIVGTPNITLGALANGMNANYAAPTNYTPVDNSVKGHLEGINTALAGSGGTPASYAEMYFQGNTTPTNIAAVNTPVKVDATYNTGEITGFTQALGTITYTALNPVVVDISANLTAYYDGSAQKTSFYIAKNGVVIAKSQQQVFIGPDTNQPIPNPCSALVPLVTNDTLELWAENNDNDEQVIVQDLNFKVSTINALGNTPVSRIAQLLWVNDASGSNSNDGNITSAYQSYAAAAAYAAPLATETNQFLIKMIGDFSATDLVLYPFVNIDGQLSGKLTLSNTISLDATFDSVPNASVFLKEMTIISPVDPTLQFNTGQQQYVELINTDIQTGNLNVVGSGSTPGELLLVSNPSRLDSNYALNLTNINAQVRYFGTPFVNVTNSTLAENYNIALRSCSVQDYSTFGTAGGTANVRIDGSSIGTVNIDGTNIFTIFDSASFTSSPNFSSGADLTNAQIKNLSDGVYQTTYVPTAYTPSGDTTFDASSVTGNFKGIDEKLAATLPDSGDFPFTYDAGNSSGFASTPVKVFGSYIRSGDFVNANLTLLIEPNALTCDLSFTAPFVGAGNFPIGVQVSMTGNVYKDATTQIAAGQIGYAANFPANLAGTDSIFVPINVVTTGVYYYLTMAFSYKWRNF